MNKKNSSLEFENFRLPNYLFLNCICTYLYSISIYYSGKHSIKDALCFIEDTVIGTFDLCAEECFHKYTLGWYYQPIDLRYMGSFTPDRNWHIPFIEFIKNNFNISYENYNVNSFSLERFLVLDRPNCFKLFIIDEYFNPCSKFSYNRVHDTHWILVKEYNEENKTAIIYDSNYKFTYEINLIDLEKSFYSDVNTQEMLIVSCVNYSNAIKIEESIKKFYARDFSSDYITNVINIYTNALEMKNTLFIFDGINNSIQSKIIPMLNYYLHILEKLQTSNSTESSNSNLNSLIEIIKRMLIDLQAVVYRNIIMINSNSYKYHQINTQKLLNIFELSETFNGAMRL